MKDLPFSNETTILKYTKELETPFYLYNAATIENQCRKLKTNFSWAHNFQNYFAVKATPNPEILRIVKNEVCNTNLGLGVDCSSEAELLLAEAVGFRGDEIFFTANNTTIREYRKALELGAIINLDDFSHVQLLHDKLALPDQICFRYNPGAQRSGNSIIGNPIEAKFGMTREQLFRGYKLARSLGCTKFFLHTMVVSNCLDEDELLNTAEMMFRLIKDLKEQINITISCVNLGGGIGIPYKPEEAAVNIASVSYKMRTLFKNFLTDEYFGTLKICFECGRFISGPSGILITRVINKKYTYKNYLGVDASIANILRPAMYGAYHHITHIRAGNSGLPPNQSLESTSSEIFDVVGSLCENNDKLAVDRHIGYNVNIGDILVFHDVGAHCSAMGFNYNGKLRCAEYLLKDDLPVLIRRAETYTDLFCTIAW